MQLCSDGNSFPESLDAIDEGRRFDEEAVSSEGDGDAIGDELLVRTGDDNVNGFHGEGYTGVLDQPVTRLSG